MNLNAKELYLGILIVFILITAGLTMFSDKKGDE